MSAVRIAFCAAVSSLSLAACSAADSWSPAQRNAAIGDALGAAVSDDDPVYDRNNPRYDHADRTTGRSYWENGEYRG